ncbi:hypothetical protein MKY87_02735 [Paenibacillus sp. FSL R7-0198]|uniref:hypothetical protein n=1 Tax=Paenibacillus sp. FSL R7-0198 TaxID=2921674 RepID=UPI0030F8DB6E
MSKFQSKSKRHRHSSNPNELHIEVSGSFKRWLVILVSALTAGTLIYLLATARESWISMGIDRYVLPFMIWGLVLSPILAFLFLKQSGRTLSHVQFLRVFGIARKKLNIQHDLAPGENVYVTYKRIDIKNSFVTENRYADIVIHAPKES